MHRAPGLPPGSLEKLKSALKTARTATQLEGVLCLWLRASLRLNSQQVATAIGWAPGAVRRFQARYLHEGEAVLEDGRGGRRHAHMTHQAEQALLDGLRPEGEAVLGLKAIHLAYEEAAGGAVPKSTVYRMLARHGWRKLGVGMVEPPKRKHPSRRLKSREDFA